MKADPQYEFKVGDVVTWSDRARAAHLIERHGPGPFTVERILRVPEFYQPGAAHDQYLYFTGVTWTHEVAGRAVTEPAKFSGYWFAPLPS